MIDTQAVAREAARLARRNGWPIGKAARVAYRRAVKRELGTAWEGDPLPPLATPPPAVVIPAFNEARTIRAIVRAFVRCPGIGPVFVVDDQSGDGTGALAEAAGAYVVPGPGISKGEAVMAGLECVDTERVIFCDADLYHFTWRHAALLAQAYRGMVVGTFENVSISNSGMRAVPTKVATALRLTGYSMESQLMEATAAAGLPLIAVDLPGVIHPARPGEPLWGGLVRTNTHARRHP